MKRIWIPQVIAIAALLWAFNPNNPYGYYIFLRWVCCGVFVYLAFQAAEQKNQNWLWVLGITALVYNPIFRVHLTREIWSAINILTIGVAIASIYKLSHPDGVDDEQEEES
jgi:FtsH-binding integral membrane protein